MKKRLLMILLVVALLVTAAVFTVQADDEILVGSTITEQTQCPCCGEYLNRIEWTPLTDDTVVTLGGHYRAQSDVTRDDTLKLQGSGKTVIYLENATLTVSGTKRVIQTHTGSVYVIGKNGTLTGQGSSDAFGGFSTVGSGELRLCGSLTVKRVDGNTTASTGGGLFYHAGGTIVVDGATIYGDACTNGGISMMTTAGNPVLTVKSGTLYGANVTGSGGVVYLDTGTVNIEGGAIHGANAVNGGAIYMNSGTLNIKDGTISGGTATTNGGGIYLSAGTASFTGGTIGATSANNGGAIYNEAASVTINGANVNGTTVTGNGGAIYSNGGSLAVQSGVIDGGSAAQGGNIYVNKGTFSITGGTISDGYATVIGGNIVSQVDFSIANATISGGVSGNLGGAIVAPGKTVTMTSGVIDGGTQNGQPYTGNNALSGGAIYAPSGTFNMQGGEIKGFKASGAGGTVYITGGTVNFGGTVTARAGTCATNGGIAYLENGAGSVTFSGTITGGTVSGNGGVASLAHASGRINVTGGTITGGTATNGGAIYVSNGTFNMTSGIITGGTATAGGNIYLAGGTNHSITGGTVKDGTANEAGNIRTVVNLNLSNCTISGGQATGAGGQLLITGGPTVTMSGTALIDGSIRNGETFTGMNASDRGGAIYMDGSTFDMQGGTIQGCASSVHGGVAAVMNGSTFEMSGDATVILDSRSSLKHVAGIFTFNSSVELSDNASIQGLGNKHSGTQGTALSLNGTPLTLSDNASVYDADNTYRRNIAANSGLVTIAEGWNGTASIQFPDAAFTGGAVPGAVIGTNYATATNYPGNLRLENIANRAPNIFKDNNVLKVSGVSVQTVGEDAAVWYPNNAAAVTDAGNVANKVIKLYTAEPLDLNGNTVYVDFNGQQNVNVTGEGTLYGIDTATVGANDAVASATVGVAEPFAVDPFTGITYVAHEGGFYPVQVKIAGVGVNPATTGIYFDSTVECNPVIKSYIKAYGLAASLGVEPNKTFYDQQGVLYTFSAGEPNGNFTGNITGILGRGRDEEFGATEVMAKGYVLLMDAEGIEEIVLSNLGQESMMSAMQKVNGMWDDLTDGHQKAVLQMYHDYEVVKGWEDLDKIVKAYEEQY